jgi:hypothetical protein
MKRTKARIHYVAAGGHLMYDCYRADYAKYWDSKYPLNDEPETSAQFRHGFKVPMPKRTSNVSKVTCTNCLQRLDLIIVNKLTGRTP